MKMRHILVRTVQTYCRGSRDYHKLGSWSKLHIDEHVKHALETQNPVVALESTVITHGMPYPQNLRTAKNLEQIVRQCGATPATIAILKGNITIGLTETELEDFAQGKSKNVLKVSRRDLPFAVAQELDGGTTVSATMLLAHLAGISIFATGGIGGVHRDGENSLDISADLTELGRTPVAVVCAGVKSILDIERTLEYLETQGVCVATIGETADFPSFFSQKSGFTSPCHVKDEREAAELLLAHRNLGLQSGILLGVPIPKKDEIPNEAIEKWVKRGLQEAKNAGVVGRDVTPFLLKKLVELSDGASLKANISLLENNAVVAAKIAVFVKDLSRTHRRSSRKIGSTLENCSVDPLKAAGTAVIIGGSVVDIMAKCSTDFEMNGSTHTGQVVASCGGVGRNIADCLTRLGTPSLLLSAIGDDYNGRFLNNACSHMDMSRVLDIPKCPSSSYVGILSKTGQLLGGVMNMEIHERITPAYISQNTDVIRNASLLLLDGNLSTDTIDYSLGMAAEHKIPVWFEPTDANKAGKPFLTNNWRSIAYLSPNLKELEKILTYFGMTISKDFFSASDAGDHVELFTPLFEILQNLRILLIKLGERGSLIFSRTDFHAPFRPQTSQGNTALFARHIQAPEVVKKDIVSVSGGGDCMVAGIIHGILRGYSLNEAVDIGTTAAACSLKSNHAVPETLADSFKNSASARK